MSADHETPTDDCADAVRAQRSRRAFRPLFQRYHARVFAYVAYRVGRNADAEDVVADIFKRALLGINAFVCQHSGSFAAWLFRIARNEIARFAERAARRSAVSLDELPPIESAQPTLESEVERREEFARLRRLLAQLSPRRREIVTLKFFGELRNHEIAESLGLDERTVAAHLCRALDDLQRLYAVHTPHGRVDHAQPA